MEINSRLYLHSSLMVTYRSTQVRLFVYLNWSQVRTTEGAVVISSRLYSRSRRSCTISECSSPRKPQRKPKPIADDTCAWQHGTGVRGPCASPVKHHVHEWRSPHSTGALAAVAFAEPAGQQKSGGDMVACTDASLAFEAPA